MVANRGRDLALLLNRIYVDTYQLSRLLVIAGVFLLYAILSFVLWFACLSVLLHSL